MTDATVSAESWVERAVERSAAVQQSRSRIANQVRLMLDAAHRLIRDKGGEFTTQDLVAEAGIALQTFYRYFGSKDELLLAVIGDAMTEACDRWVTDVAEIPDPLERLRFFITAPLEQFRGERDEAAAMRFMVFTHWQLHRLFPNELAEAVKPFAELLLGEINVAADAGLLHSRNPQWDAWLIVELLRSVYHHYAYAVQVDDDMTVVGENLWHFCRTALGVSLA
jgi:TetR/AcrR family transcriptional regulator